MFPIQNMSSKRAREDDSDSEGGDGYGWGGQQVKVRSTKQTVYCQRSDLLDHEVSP